MRKRGSDYIWMGKRGEQAHLNRDIVKEIKRRLDFWLRTGSLKRPGVKTKEATDSSGESWASSGGSKKRTRIEKENAKLRDDIQELTKGEH